MIGYFVTLARNSETYDQLIKIGTLKKKKKHREKLRKALQKKYGLKVTAVEITEDISKGAVIKHEKIQIGPEEKEVPKNGDPFTRTRGAI